MNSIDIRNAFESNEQNFTCILLRLICKADPSNMALLRQSYPAEVKAVEIYRTDCPYLIDRTPDYEQIAEKAMEAAQESLGATGDYPEGKISEEDEGGLRMAIGADLENNIVSVDFGKAIWWIGLGKEDALELAGNLQKQAAYLKD